MLRLRVKSNTRQARRRPNIFIAARDNDLAELALAIQDGQKLSDTIPENGHTPLHTAAIWGNEEFIKAALRYDHANVWQWDQYDKLPYDHANARGDTHIMKLFFHAMYPNGRVPIPADDNEPS